MGARVQHLYSRADVSVSSLTSRLTSGRGFDGNHPEIELQRLHCGLPVYYLSALLKFSRWRFLLEFSSPDHLGSSEKLSTGRLCSEGAR